jgi:hypothetical protein
MKQAIAARKCRIAILVLVFLHLSACALPDLRPFAEATASLDLVVRQTRALVVRDLTAVADEFETRVPASSTQVRALRDAASAFSVEWAERVETVQALLAYSDSLASISQAGRRGSDNSQVVAESFNKLLDSVPSVTAQIPAAAVDLTAWIGSEVARVGAHRSLVRSVEAAHPVVLEIATLIAADFDVIAANLPQNFILAEALLQNQYGDLVRYRERLVERRARVSARIEAMPANSAIPVTDQEEAMMVARLLTEADAWYGPYLAEEARIAMRRDLAIEIATQAKATVERWARVHGEIAQSLEDGRLPEVGVLVNKARELQALVDRLGETG